MPLFSVIVPVYNRRDEVEELLLSLSGQIEKDFETIIIEDGSSERCEDIVLKYSASANVKYFYKPNGGRSQARNYGMQNATGSWFVFFDSDCVIPSSYFFVAKSA
ncbi:MAG: glycosyltransferase family A protein, partial [Bacteroidales bacterium]